MPVVRSREVAVTVVGLSLVTVLSIVAAVLSSDAAGDFPSGSSLSKAADGSAAAYLTLQDLGYVISRSVEPVALLSIDPASTVLVVADPSREASAGDRRAVQSLVSAGATIVVTGCLGASFLTEPRESMPGVGPAREFRALLPSPLTAGVSKISMDARCSRPALAPRFLGIYGDSGVEVVRMARIGRGLAVWWAGNTPIANATIHAPGHLELLLNAVGGPGRTILWDEFYHGHQRSLYSYAKQTPLPWLGAQLGLVVAVAALMFVRRRAPVVERAVEARVSPLEFVDTMSDLYARVHAAAEAVATARTRLRRLLVEATGIAPSAADDRLSRVAAARTGASEKELAQVLAATAAVDATILPGEALSLVRRMQECARAVGARAERSERASGTERALQRERLTL